MFAIESDKHPQIAKAQNKAEVTDALKYCFVCFSFECTKRNALHNSENETRRSIPQETVTNMFCFFATGTVKHHHRVANAFA